MFKKILIISLFLLLPLFSYASDNRLLDGFDEWKAEQNKIISASQVDGVNKTNVPLSFEEWQKQKQALDNAVDLSATTDVSNNTSDLETKTVAQNIVIDQFSKSFITGLFLVVLVGVTGLISWAYSKITKKRIQPERNENGIIVASRVERLADFAIDFFILINGLFALISYLAIQNAWYGFFEHRLSFWISGIILYYLLFEWIFGRTPGKFITRTKIITTRGNKPNFSQILGRTLSRLMPFEIFSFMGTNPLGWHDRWSNTMVVQSSYIPTDETNSADTKYCKECGNKIHVSTTICNRCNKII